MSTETEVLEEKVETTEVADDTGYSKYQQQLDQERANTKRAKQELDTITQAYEEASERLEETTSRLQGLEGEIASLKQTREATEAKLDALEDMDPDMVDEKVAKNIKLLESRMEKANAVIKAKEKQLEEVMGKISAYEKKQAETERQQQIQQTKDAVCSTVEKQMAKFGVPGAAKYRNEAGKLADELVDSGEAKKPTTFNDAIDLLMDCYLKVHNKKSPSSKTVAVDTGKGGVTPPATGSSKIKPGRLRDVVAQMREDRSWLD